MKTGPLKTAGYAAYLLGLVFVFVLFMEFVFPRLKGLTREEYLCPWYGRKNLSLVGTKINSQGFTGDLPEPEKGEGEIRILTLGGSSFFYRNMTERLKKAFKRKGWKGIKITGAALSAHTTRSSVLKFKYLLPDYKFDYVIIYHGVNDLLANRVSPADFRADYSHLDPNYRDTGSILLKLIYDHLIWKKSPRTDEYYYFPSEETFRNNLIYLIREARRRGGEPILMTYATYIPEGYSRRLFSQGKLGYNHEYRILHHPVEDWGTVKHVREGLFRHNRVIRELAERYQVPLIDQEILMRDLFLDRPADWFSDFCHLSIPGTEKFIGNITDYFALMNQGSQ